MKNHRRYLAVALAPAALLFVAACGDGADTTPEGDSSATSSGTSGTLEVAITSADLAVGRQRFAFVPIEDGVPVTDVPFTVRFFKLGDDGNASVQVGQGTLPWSPLGVEPAEDGHGHAGSIEETEVTGVYYANVEFDTAGKWGAGFSRGERVDEANEVRVQFEVRAEAQAPAFGDKAIPSSNPTLDDAPLQQIHSTPDSPDESFHQLSIAEAINSGKPTVISFTTPAYCVTRTCGPSLAVVKKATESVMDEVNVVHVEPYQLDAEGSLLTDADGQRVNAEAANEWQLPSEPWAFVVDREGIIVGRFDGPVTVEELEYAINQLLN